MFDIHRIYEVIENNYNDAYPQYGEDYRGNEIMVADWNRVPKKLISFIEQHTEALFHDQIVTDDNNVFHRIDEDTWLLDCNNVISVDELDDDESLREYIIFNLTDNHHEALNVRKLVKRLPAIATLVESDYQWGLHQHMTDNPKTIMESHPDYGKGTLFFSIKDSNMFSVDYDLWKIKEDDDETV